MHATAAENTVPRNRTGQTARSAANKATAMQSVRRRCPEHPGSSAETEGRARATPIHAHANGRRPVATAASGGGGEGHSGGGGGGGGGGDGGDGEDDHGAEDAEQEGQFRGLPGPLLLSQASTARSQRAIGAAHVSALHAVAIAATRSVRIVQRLYAQISPGTCR